MLKTLPKGMLGALLFIGIASPIGWRAMHTRNDDESSAAKLRTVYAIYNHPGCMTAADLDKEVGYIVRAEKLFRGTEMPEDMARAKIEAFVTEGIPHLWWVRFTLYPGEQAQWRGPRADACDHNPNA